MSQIDSKRPKEAKILPMSFLSGILVMSERRAGSKQVFKHPTIEATMTNHHSEGPVMQANTSDQRPIEISPKIAKV